MLSLGTRRFLPQVIVAIAVVVKPARWDVVDSAGMELDQSGEMVRRKSPTPMTNPTTSTVSTMLSQNAGEILLQNFPPARPAYRKVTYLNLPCVRLFLKEARMKDRTVEVLHQRPTPNVHYQHYCW
jgi:hypothetical protein